METSPKTPSLSEKSTGRVSQALPLKNLPTVGGTSSSKINKKDSISRLLINEPLGKPSHEAPINLKTMGRLVRRPRRGGLPQVHVTTVDHHSSENVVSMLVLRISYCRVIWA